MHKPISNYVNVTRKIKVNNKSIQNTTILKLVQYIKYRVIHYIRNNFMDILMEFNVVKRS